MPEESYLDNIRRLRVDKTLYKNPNVVTFTTLEGNVVEIRDFQTTGVVAFVQGLPFTKMSSKTYKLPEKEVKINPEYLQNCIDVMDLLIEKL